MNREQVHFYNEQEAWDYYDKLSQNRVQYSVSKPDKYQDVKGKDVWVITLTTWSLD
jgi:hypothetical protein